MSTRNLIALILFLIAGVPLIGSAWTQYQQDLRRGDSERDQRLRSVNNDLYQELSALLAAALETARADGGMPGLAELLHSEALDDHGRLLANRYLTAFGSRDPLNITSVALLDANGGIRASTDPADPTAEESTTPYVREVIRLGIPTLVGPYQRAHDRFPGLFIAAPVRNAADQLIGIVRSRYEASILDQVLENKLRNRSDLGVALLDQHSQPIAEAGVSGSPDLLGKARATVNADVVGSSGETMRAIASLVPRAGWRLVVFEPEATRQARHGERRSQWLQQLALLTVLLGAAALLIGALIARPVVRLHRAVDAMAEGDLQGRVAARGTREFRRLADAFNAMNQRLGQNLEQLSAELAQRTQAERALRESEQRLSTLIEQIPGTVYRCHTGLHGSMLFLSGRVTELTGYPAEALLHNRDLTFDSLVHPDDYAAVETEVGAASAQRRPFELRYRLFRRDGSLRWVWDRGQAHYGADGKAQWLDGVMLDVTDRERADQALRALRASTEGRVGMDYFDSLTRQLCTSLGLRVAVLARVDAQRELQALACSVNSAPAPLGDTVRALQACQRVLDSGNSAIAGDPGESATALAGIGLPLRSQQGEVIGVLAVLDPRPLDDAERIVDLLHVCAARVLAEIERSDAQRALQALAAELEQRVRTRTADLEASNAKLSLAMEQLVQTEKLASLGSLVAGVAHELNTPLGNALTASTSLHASMKAFQKEVDAGQLRRSSLSRFISEGDEAGSIIERNLHRAAELIGHFKQVAVDQTSARRRRFDLRATIEEVLTTLQPRLKRLPHRIEVEVPAGVQLDSYPGALEQVITNLISNSLDHAFAAGQSGRIRISADSDATRVQLHYRDDGGGIPAEHQRRVFDPFFTTRLGSGGSGLGLYLVHSLVSGTLSGTLQLRSAPGQGVQFDIDLPLTAPALVESTDSP